MDYRILGPLEVLDGERRLTLGGTRQRAVLALLLLHGNEALPSEVIVDELFAQDEIARLEVVHIAGVEDRIEADLALGGHAELAPELESLVARHPVRERLRGQLMLALYRSGRQAEALAAYREARRTLLDELGIEPGRALQELERAILAQEPGLDATPSQPAVGAVPGRRAASPVV